MQILGFVNRRISRSVQDAADVAATELQASGVPLVGRIDHAAAARAAGLKMPASIVLIFGNATVGTPLMISHPTVAIDLPLRLLLWEDEEGSAWVGYNDPFWLGDRHGVTPNEHPTLERMRDILERLSDVAAGA